MKTKNLVKENLYEFTRNSNPLDTLGIGYVGKIYKFFDDFGIHRDEYTIEDGRIKFWTGLNLFESNITKFPFDDIQILGFLELRGSENLTELPKRMDINNYLTLTGCINLIKLPDNLKVKTSLYLRNCSSLENLSNTFEIGGHLWLTGCDKLFKVPDNMDVDGNIYVAPNQKKLISFIKSTKFRNQLFVRQEL